MYSYKEPRKKPLLDRVSKMWFSFISIIVAGIFGYWLYLSSESSSYANKIEMLESSNNILSNSVEDLEKELKILNMQQVLSTEIKNSNRLLNNSIKNLFNLVPDQIVLLKVLMKKDVLTLEGLSSTKDAYRLLLEPPLKSIFNDSRVTFDFDTSLGKYKFKSINSINNESKEPNNGEK